MSTREHLLAEVEAFLARTGMGPTYLGQRAGIGTDFVKRLRAGRDVMTDTADAAFTFMRSYQPDQPAAGRRRARRA